MAVINKCFSSFKSPTVLLLFTLSLRALAIRVYDFQIVYEWKQIEYKFKDEAERTQAIKNGTFTLGNVVPVEAQYSYFQGRERVFITTPKVANSRGPATIGVVTNGTRDGNPVLEPYPTLSWHLNPEKCLYHRLVSVFRLWVDECNRLWVVDSGNVDDVILCPPQIVVFDLKTDTLLFKYEIPKSQYQKGTLFMSQIAEVENHSCENTWLYVTDCATYSLLVYTLKQNASWIIKDKTFESTSNYTVYHIGEDTVQFADGLFTVALTPDKKRLYYHAASDNRESWVYVNDLKNRSNFGNPNSSPQLFHTLKNRRNQQSFTEAFDREGNLYFSLLIDVKLAKWNPKNAYTSNHFEIVASDYERMQIPSTIKVLPYKGGEYDVLWVFSNRYVHYAAGKLNGSETNFRLFSVNL